MAIQDLDVDFLISESFISGLLISGHPRGAIMKYTRFEKARIIGARSLQVSLGAVLIDIPEGRSTR